jgi:murein DD-endopeptidase MepM/ murein hydrolase activator NlpD
MKMGKRFALLLVIGFALTATPAVADNNYGQQKAALDTKLAATKARISKARSRESQLNGQIGSLNTQINALESRVADVASRMSALRTDLALRRRRLDVLNSLYRTQTARVRELRGVYRIAVARLDLQLVAMYKDPQPGVLEVALQAKTFQDVLDEINYLRLAARQDQAIEQQVASAKHRVVLARARTLQVRHNVTTQTNLINARLEQVAIIHNELLTSTHTLSKARSGKGVALMVARTQERAAIQESNATAAASAEIEAKIRAAERAAAAARATQPTTASAAPSPAPATSSSSAPSPSSPQPAAGSAGLSWPVNGPITSPFGPRWGGFHPGIDIGVPTGTPIHAAAAGTVIWCGWQSGYGNLVVIDHHDGIATAYGHQSRIAVGCNQEVAQGQVIGYSGCTGFCTGPHLHFEVRLNGTPVDPIGYLP